MGVIINPPVTSALYSNKKAYMWPTTTVAMQTAAATAAKISNDQALF
jgi:hypothetical protein